MPWSNLLVLYKASPEQICFTEFTSSGFIFTCTVFSFISMMWGIFFFGRNKLLINLHTSNFVLAWPIWSLILLALGWTCTLTMLNCSSKATLQLLAYFLKTLADINKIVMIYHVNFTAFFSQNHATCFPVMRYHK